MAVVVDDRLLLDTLARTAPAGIIAEMESGGLFTTSAWYYRLGRAAVAGSGSGALSGPLQLLAPADRERVIAALYDLPENVGVLSPRDTVPVMMALRVRRPLNMLNAEALAVALLASADIVVTTDAPLLRSGARDVGVEYRLLS